ncbi:aromatic acid exporter family protein [Cytobacillus sp. S13-E01]|uniref:aromatic acid exporter family protein n=1 Tax=Cytobacillus sp. S13-E01 TaxID=3031326 RepID=UPI0023D8A535|nr:aromatic acid exporter family protein [Cytobacillus sp. S13-E01]MDF0727372.1 aromatic acid exporter family protein [Cytobacillus sp. S13-E01]
MYKIGYRTAKTAIGTAAAIAIAQFLQFDNFASAGILTLLCVQVTKKKSLRSSWDRFLACIIGIAFSFVIFESIGYNPLAIGILLLFFIPTLVMVKAKDGIATSTVIILHIFTSQQITAGLLLNEIGIISIGIGVALLVNLYMPSVESELKRYQEKIEVKFGVIFKEMVKYLRLHDYSWDGKEITETEELLSKASTLAFRDVENHFLRNENIYYHYFKMREKQFENIERMLPIITSITHSVEQGEMIAAFLEEISEAIHPGNTAIKFLNKMEDMKKQFKEMDLPDTREEFEARAALLLFLKEMEQYLQIKRSFRDKSS